MAQKNPPKLFISLSLSETTYHFSNPHPPELSLTITSNSDKPLTIFARNTILWPKLALVQRRFTIKDLTTGNEVPQTSIQPQCKPVLDSPDEEEYYLTIHPDNTPTTVSTPFGPASDVRPRSKAVAQQGWEYDHHGNRVEVRRKVHARGVDGLEVGHWYRLDVAKKELRGVWWRWGTREEVMVRKDSSDRIWSREQSERAALEFETIKGVEFNVED